MDTRENAQEPRPNQPPYVPLGIPHKDYVREDARHKSPLIATLMSLMPGLGQIYVGYYQQGFINIVVIAGLICLLNSNFSRNLEPFFGLFLAFYWLFNMVDAYRKATFYNQALAGLGAFEIPEGERFSGKQGSFIGGVLLIVVGVIALGYTRFGMPLEWIETWWPVGLILMGAYLFYQAVANKKKQE